MKKIVFFMMAATVILATGCSSKDEDVAVERVTLNKQTLELTVNAKETLVATITPSEATNKTLVWSSDKPDIADVAQTGEVSGVKAGTANITVTAHNGQKATCAVTVKVPSNPVTGVDLNETSIELLIGATFDLVATVKPANADNKNVTWSSDKPEIATVDDNGKVTAVSAGTTTVVVVTSEKGFTKECQVVVKHIVATGIALENLEIGTKEKLTLSATVTPANTTDLNFTWSAVSAIDPNYKGKAKEGDEVDVVLEPGMKDWKEVLTITRVDGTSGAKLEPIRKGKATITVKTANNKEASCEVTVTEYNELIIGEKFTIEVWEDNQKLTGFTFTSDDPAKVSVNSTSGRATVLAGFDKVVIKAKKDAVEKLFKYWIVEEGTDPNTFTCDPADTETLNLLHGGSSKKWTWNPKTEGGWQGTVWGNGGFIVNTDIEWWGQPLSDIGPDYGEGSFMTFKSDGTFSTTNSYGETVSGTFCISMKNDVKWKFHEWSGSSPDDDWNIGRLHVTTPILRGTHGGGNGINKFFVKNFFITKLSANEMIIASSVEHWGWGGTWYWRFKVKND